MLVVVVALAAALAACTEYTTIAAGPTLVVAPEERRPSGAIMVEAAEGGGTTRDDGRRSSFLDVRARVIVAERHQHLAALVGISGVSWHGRDTPLWYGAGVGIGGERIPDNGFFELTGQLRAGSGFTLAEKTSPLPTFGPWATGMPPPQMRRRSVFVLGLAAETDVRFTRDPMFVVSLLFGLATFDEVLPAREPPPPLRLPW